MTATITPAQLSTSPRIFIGSTRPAPTPSLLRSISLNGPAGRLEALLNEGSADAPYAALVCHPHPLGGGSMHNKVVYHTMKVLNDQAWGLNWPVLRFNFRGTGLSEGAHDGKAESEDVLAALHWLVNEYNRPILVAGFSFGAAMSLRACSTPSQADPKPSFDIRALIALGLPTHVNGRDYKYPFLAQCTIPKLFLSGDHDQFAPQAQWEQVAGSAAEPKKLVLLPGADHFFTGQLEPLQLALSSWLKEQLP